MLVWRLNLAWKSGHPNQCLRLGDNAKTDRTLRARFRESASYSSALIVRAKTLLSASRREETEFGVTNSRCHANPRLIAFASAVDVTI
jgi:hypothetical protein